MKNAKKKGNEENKLSRCRKWTEDEHELFAIILAEEESSFAVNQEILTFLLILKKKWTKY